MRFGEIKHVDFVCDERIEWFSHVMAPAIVRIFDETIVAFGGWDARGISRIFIGLVDSSSDRLHSVKLLLDVGNTGLFFDNGVFPGHWIKTQGGAELLSFTGFQNYGHDGQTNFSGLMSVVDNCGTVLSNVPFLDRSEKGLFVRAGHSAVFNNGSWWHAYSVGSRFDLVGGKDRPCYDICCHRSENLLDRWYTDEVVLKYDRDSEHGLGRPQIFHWGTDLYVVFTVRSRDMKYSWDMAHFRDGFWNRLFLDVPRSGSSWDSEMAYFPSVEVLSESMVKVWYCGNGFGRDGFGYVELTR